MRLHFILRPKRKQQQCNGLARSSLFYNILATVVESHVEKSFTHQKNYKLDFFKLSFDSNRMLSQEQVGQPNSIELSESTRLL